MGVAACANRPLFGRNAPSHQARRPLLVRGRRQAAAAARGQALASQRPRARAEGADPTMVRSEKRRVVEVVAALSPPLPTLSPGRRCHADWPARPWPWPRLRFLAGEA